MHTGFGHFIFSLFLAFVLLCLVISLVGLLAGCAGVQQGPPIELADIAVPKVVSDAQERPPPPKIEAPPVSLPLPRHGFKIWIPRLVTPNGDVYEGHYVDVSDTPPKKELTKPDYEIPKAPKQIYRPAVKPAAAPQRPSTPAPAAAPWPAPPGLSQMPGTPNAPVLQEGGYEPLHP